MEGWVDSIGDSLPRPIRTWPFHGASGRDRAGQQLRGRGKGLREGISEGLRSPASLELEGGRETEEEGEGERKLGEEVGLYIHLL